MHNSADTKTWECACGIINSMNDVVCVGCGWTYDKYENYKKGVSIVPDKKECKMLALKTYKKENKYFRQAIVISLLSIPIMIAIAYYFNIGLENILFNFVVVVILLCCAIIAVCINGILYTERQYKEFIIEEEQNEPIGSSNVHIEAPQKIVPTSGINIRRRVVGFLFGASIPIWILFELSPDHGIVIKYIGNWKYILYLAIILGLIGFLIGDKYYDNVSNYLSRIKKYL